MNHPARSNGKYLAALKRKLMAINFYFQNIFNISAKRVSLYSIYSFSYRVRLVIGHSDRQFFLLPADRADRADFRRSLPDFSSYLLQSASSLKI